MSRLLEKLKEYDDSVTVGQLIQKIEAEQISAKEKEEKEIEQIKNQFENRYFKLLEEQSLFGRELNIYKFENLERKERDTDWEFIYSFNGFKISFSEGETFSREFTPNRTGNSFSAKKLKEMTEISETEYNE